MKIIPYILYLYLLAFFYSILSEIITIYGVTIDLTVLMIALIVFYKSEEAALWFSSAAAIIAATQRPSSMPWEIISLAGVAVIANQLKLRMNLESLVSRLIILGGFLLIHNIAITASISLDNFAFVFIRYIIPGTAYTLLVGWLIFFFSDNRSLLKSANEPS
ncbi:MAG: hypothetical protein NTV06_09725 [candidate division Zixibacteria bacterium]|nr:hypothetical protein [candidate division Zixibacteria bacterium]